MKLVKIVIFFVFIASSFYIKNIASGENFSYDETKCSVEISKEPSKKSDCAMNTIQENSPFLLRFLYNNFFGTFIRKSLTKKWFSVAAGWYCNQTISRYHIEPFCKQHSIELSHAEKDISEFNTFNDFFIRKLKPEARLIDRNPHSIVSPADGKIIVMQLSTKSMRFPVKQSQFNLEQFLGCPNISKSFEGGTIMIFRLAPYDYHRFHFPLDCIPLKAQIIHGQYESVNPIVYYLGIQPLTENERHLTLLATKECGNVALVSVGALCVGKIIETYKPLKWYPKGDEAGYFCFGGSTIVLIFKKGVLEVHPDILKNSQEGQESSILMGQMVAKIIS